MYNVTSLKAEEFISDEEIQATLAYADANKDNVALIDEIIAKAKERKGLTHREARFMRLPSSLKRIITATVLSCLLRFICRITVSMAVSTVHIMQRTSISHVRN